MIAIIAILAAILFPVFARAREKARASSCLSNVKQVMLAFLMYAQDYDDRTPLNMSYSPVACHWYNTLQPYMKNASVLRCPSEPDLARSYSQPYAWGYYKLSAGPITNTYGGGIPLAKIRKPAEVMAFGEVRTNGSHGCFTTTGTYGYDIASFDRHNDGMNCGLVDGHAKWMSKGSLDGVWSTTPGTSTLFWDS